jgi:hypothetical protein
MKKLVFLLKKFFCYLRISPTTASAINRLYSYPPGEPYYVVTLTSRELFAQFQSGYELIENYFRIK